MARWRRLSRNETLAASLAALVLVVLVFFWVIRPWLWGKPAQKIAQPPMITVPGTTVKAPAAPPSGLTVEQAYADFRALSFKTSEQNGDLIKQNSELIEDLRVANDSRVSLADSKARLEEQAKTIRTSNRVLRARVAALNKRLAYPVATKVEYIGCPCPTER